MKKKLLSLFVLCSFISYSQLEISKEDLLYKEGNQWNNKVITSQTLYFSTGSGKTWDFSALTGSSTDETKVVTSNSTSVKISSTLKGDFNYKVVDSSYTFASLSGVTADNPYSASLGFPHYLGKKWSGSATGFGGFVTVNLSGEVLASGQITTALGTEECLLVKETITGQVNEIRYFWETKNYGRIATYYKDSKELVVTESYGISTGNSWGSGWEITKNDLYWGLGKKVVTEFVSLSPSSLSSSLNIQGGDNLVWDFTKFNGGYLDTGMVSYDDGTLVKVASSSKIEQHFNHSDSTFTMVKIEGVTFDNPNTSTIGLPHRFGKKWSGDNTILGGLVQVKVQGEVVGRGTAKIGLGTFPCLLIKEVATGGMTATNYYWETTEHGRVAAYFSAYDELAIMKARYETPQNISNSDVVINESNLNWYNGFAGASLTYTLDSLSAILNLNAGNNQNWDFSTLTGGIIDSIKIATNARVHYNLLLGTGKLQEFYEDNGVYFYETIEGVKIDTTKSIALGLPFVFGKKWYCAGTANASDFTLTGNVIGQGSITVTEGTFNCLLVEEQILGGLNASNYYWYTSEHGRIASYLDSSNELVLAKVEKTNSTVEIESQNLLSLFPNPSQKGLVTVSTQNIPSQIRVINSNGDVVLYVLNAKTFDTSNLSSGIYMIEITIDNSINGKRLIVQ